MGVCIAQQLWILQMTLVSCTLLTVPISVQDFVAYSRIEIEMGHCRLIVACHGHSCARVVLESALASVCGTTSMGRCACLYAYELRS